MASDKIKVISRSSALARIQTTELLARFPDFKFEITAVESFGDLRPDISLLDDPPSDIFTRELDEAVVSGRADLAVHSAKDLPFPLPEKLAIAALTDPIDDTEALVSRGKVPLASLKRAARIGVSSPRRREELRKIRPDLEFAAIRGTIEKRLRLCESGEIDALVVATCALKRLGLQDRIAEILPFRAHPLQGRLAVTCRFDRSDLKVLLHRIDARNSFGRVWLVGAGPGDVDLLTVRARKVMENAGLILYDDLVDPLVLDGLSADKIYVGKRNGRHSFEESEIRELMYESSKKGIAVVRLKGGDPFIFGRGGEEHAYLSERMIDVAVVPGVTAALAAAAEAAFPLTMRGISRSVTLHTARSSGDGDIQPDVTGTSVYYMGADSKTEAADALRTQGYSGETPVFMVRNAGRASVEIERSRLDMMHGSGLASPVIILAGEAGSVTRAPERVLCTGLELPLDLRGLRGVPVHFPLISVSELPGEQARVAIGDTRDYDGIIFTSRTAVRIFCGLYPSAGNGKKIGAIGLRTAAELLSRGIRADIVPGDERSSAFASALRESGLKKILYPCSDISDNDLHRLPFVRPVRIYRTSPRESRPGTEIPPLKSFTGVFFSSASTVRAFAAVYGNFPAHLVYYSIGPVTSGELRKHGVPEEVILDVSKIQTRQAR